MTMLIFRFVICGDPTASQLPVYTEPAIYGPPNVRLYHKNIHCLFKKQSNDCLVTLLQKSASNMKVMSVVLYPCFMRFLVRAAQLPAS